MAWNYTRRYTTQLFLKHNRKIPFTKYMLHAFYVCSCLSTYYIVYTIRMMYMCTFLYPILTGWTKTEHFIHEKKFIQKCWFIQIKKNGFNKPHQLSHFTQWIFTKFGLVKKKAFHDFIVGLHYPVKIYIYLLNYAS